MKQETKAPVVSLGMSLGVLVNKNQLTLEQWISLLEIRQRQIAKMLNKVTLPNVGSLLLAGGKEIGDHNHILGMDEPEFNNGLCDSMMQVLEVARRDFREDGWPDCESQVNIIALNRRDGNWVIVGVRYLQRLGGYKKALVVKTWKPKTEDVLEECKHHYSPSQIWFGLATAFEYCCTLKEAQLKECAEVMQWFNVEAKVFHAHEVKVG